jgi:outer membrane murein-binding lipoprotein Lpp
MGPDGERLVVVPRTHKTRRTALVRTGAAVLALTALLAGCSSLKKTIDKINRSNSASAGLESFIHDELTTKFHRSVRSVSCTPAGLL